MSTTDVGNAAEQAVAEDLACHGFTILDRNWKTKWCEVDIIACKANVIWFVEVKYRQTERFGSGLEYVGPSKLRHLKIAADLWVSQRKYGGEYTLGAVSVSQGYIIGELVEI